MPGLQQQILSHQSHSTSYQGELTFSAFSSSTASVSVAGKISIFFFTFGRNVEHLDDNVS